MFSLKSLFALPKKQTEDIDLTKRNFLIAGGICSAAVLVPKVSFAANQSMQPRFELSKTLKIYNVNTREHLTTTYFDGENYIPDEIAKLNYMFRDRRSGLVTSMDTNVYDLIHLLLKRLGKEDATFNLVCGYRSLATNNKLRQTHTGVAKKSYHTKGKAVDCYVEGVSLNKLRQEALKLKMGGVGIYPKSGFVHLDVGPIRAWRG